MIRFAVLVLSFVSVCIQSVFAFEKNGLLDACKEQVECGGSECRGGSTEKIVNSYLVGPRTYFALMHLSDNTSVICSSIPIKDGDIPVIVQIHDLDLEKIHIAILDSSKRRKLSGRRFVLQAKSGNEYYYHLTDDLILVSVFGALCDGVTDDSLAVGRAAHVAAKLGKPLVFPIGKVCLLGDSIVIENGLPLITGGRVKLSATNNSGGFFLKGKESGAAKNVSELDIVDIEIDLNNRGPGIYGQNSNKISIKNIHIKNQIGSYGILFKAFSNKGNGDAIGIYNSKFESDVSGEPLGETIKFSAQYDTLGLSFPEYWSRFFVVPEAKSNFSGVVINNNVILGGYYGVGLYSVVDSEVSQNYITSNMRSISCQNNCKRNSILDNELHDSISSAVHLAYGAEDNLVQNNDIRTNRSRGEGLLQAYISPHRNRFISNYINSRGTGAKYHIYIGYNAVDNVVEGNFIVGGAQKAYIALESGSNSKEKYFSHRGSFTNTDGLANRASVGNRIAKNVIRGTSPVPAIFLSQISDLKGDYWLENTVVNGNIITGGAVSPFLYVLEHKKGGLKNFSCSGNKYPSRSKNSRIITNSDKRCNDR